MRRHFEAAEFDQTEPPRRAVGRIQLVDAELGAVRVAGEIDQQVAQQPVDQPGLQGFLAGLELVSHLLEGDFQLVEAFVARLVDARRLAGGADEQAGEQVGECRVVLPVADQAHQQIGPSQAGRIGGRGRANRDVVAATGAGVAAVEHEFLGAEAGEACLFVKRLCVLHQLRPAAGGMDIHLDHAGIGRDAE